MQNDHFANAFVCKKTLCAEQRHCDNVKTFESLQTDAIPYKDPEI